MKGICSPIRNPTDHPYDVDPMVLRSPVKAAKSGNRLCKQQRRCGALISQTPAKSRLTAFKNFPKRSARSSISGSFLSSYQRPRTGLPPACSMRRVTGSNRKMVRPSLRA